MMSGEFPDQLPYSSRPFHMLRRLLFSLLFVVVPLLGWGQNYTAEQYRAVELQFSADTTFSYQPRDLSLWTTFMGPDGQEIEIAGFWNGDNRFNVRFAPPTVGTWEYRTVSSDSSLSSLHDQSGTIEVTPYMGPDHFATHGRPKISNNGRFLTYADGTPYFYLGDTAWEISWKSRKEQVVKYLDDRERKGFNAIQIVVMSHQRLRKHGVRNRYNEPFFQDDNFSRINPRYFDYVDWIVDQVNDRGMIAVLVPLWAYMTELYPETGPQNKLSEQEALALGRYIGARYAGHNVLWFIGGDNSYETPARKRFWDQFAQTVDAASGRQHLMTVHPMGYAASYEYFSADTTDWLDFHAYQSSHIAGGDFTWTGAQRGYDLQPSVPILNAEATYEDIFHRFWAPGDTSSANTFRIRPVHVRQSSYESVLSGGLVGMTYGGNGIWQWSTEELPGSHNPRYRVEDAWEMPGSQDMGLLKRLMHRLDWYKLRPSQEIIVQESAPDYVPVAASQEHITAYLPAGTESVTLDLSELEPAAGYRWIDPASGDTLNDQPHLLSTKTPQPFTPPDSTDWLLAIEHAQTINPGNPSTDASFETLGNVPNPFSSTTEIRFNSEVAGTIRVTVWNLLGQKVQERIGSTQTGTTAIPVQVRQAGLYLYRAVFTSLDGRQTVRRGKMLAIPE